MCPEENVIFQHFAPWRTNPWGILNMCGGTSSAPITIFSLWLFTLALMWKGLVWMVVWSAGKSLRNLNWEKKTSGDSTLRRWHRAGGGRSVDMWSQICSSEALLQMKHLHLMYKPLKLQVHSSEDYLYPPGVFSHVTLQLDKIIVLIWNFYGPQPRLVMVTWSFSSLHMLLSQSWC